MSSGHRLDTRDRQPWISMNSRSWTSVPCTSSAFVNPTASTCCTVRRTSGSGWVGSGIDGVDDSVLGRGATHRARGGREMKKLLSTVLSMSVVVALSASAAVGQTCPAEVASAKGMLTRVANRQDAEPSRSLAGARSQEIQAPRSQEIQAPRSQEIQAPRAQEIQAPRGQELQAPRAQEIQAPRGQEMEAARGQEIQAPRGQEIQAPRSQELQAPRSPEFMKASALVSEAEAACKAGKSSLAADKAKAAMELLKK